MKKYGILLMLVLAVVLSSTSFAFRKPYKEAKYAKVETWETAYVVPLEEDAKKQVKLDSAGAYDKYKVMAKRISIPQRWHQTGRRGYQGKWIPTVKVVKVNRTPVTEEYSADKDKGTKRTDNGIDIESQDSVGFSVGFTVTAYIPESDTSTYLYMYPNTSLNTIINSEIRGRIQMVASDIAQKYDMDECREKKGEINAAVRDDVIPFFKERGIMITTIGMFGGFTYKNPDIQRAIDDVFSAQQLKEIAKAKFEAQEDLNKTIEKEALALKQKAITIAEGEANGIELVANAKAGAIKAISIASAEAGEKAIIFQQLENQRVLIEKWNGQYPQTMMSGGNPMSLLVTMPENK